MNRFLLPILALGLSSAPSLAQGAEQPALAAEGVSFLGAYCTSEDAKSADLERIESLKLSFKKFVLDYNPALAGAHTAHCKVVIQTKAVAGQAFAIKSADVSLTAATGGAFKAQLGMAVFDGQKVVSAKAKDISSGELPAKYTMTLPAAEGEILAPCQQNGGVYELTFSMIAVENGEQQPGAMAIDAIDNIVTEARDCVEVAPAAQDDTPKFSLKGFGDGQKGPCSFLFDGGKLNGFSRPMAGDRVFGSVYTSGTKRGLVAFWDTIGSNTMSCNFTVSVSKGSAFQMKFLGATLPVAENDDRNNPIAAKITVSQQRSSGDARKYVFSTTDVAPQKVSVAGFELEGDEVTKCSNGHNFKVSLTFEVEEAEHIQHLWVLNGPTFITRHQPCGLGRAISAPSIVRHRGSSSLY